MTRRLTDLFHFSGSRESVSSRCLGFVSKMQTWPARVQLWHWLAEAKTHFFLLSRQNIHARTALLRSPKGTGGRNLFDGRVGGEGMADPVNPASGVTR